MSFFPRTCVGDVLHWYVLMHAYGGAKSGMAQALQSIASEGWIPRRRDGGHSWQTTFVGGPWAATSSGHYDGH